MRNFVEEEDYWEELFIRLRRLQYSILKPNFTTQILTNKYLRYWFADVEGPKIQVKVYQKKDLKKLFPVLVPKNNWNHKILQRD